MGGTGRSISWASEMAAASAAMVSDSNKLRQRHIHPERFPHAHH